jgi:hypothetical protein
MRRERRLAAQWYAPGLLLLIVACFGTVSSAAEVRGLLRLDGHHVKWGAPAYGAGAEVTYSYLTRTRSFADARNCAAMLPLSVVLNLSDIKMPDFEREVRAALALWAERADIAFRYVEDAEAADIVIGAQDGARGVAFANIFQEVGGGGRIARINKATICLDPAEHWEIGRDGDPATYNVRRVMAHEIGHALGLDHLGADGGLMGYDYPEPMSGPLAKLEPTDAAAIARLYGSDARQDTDIAGDDRATMPGRDCDALVSGRSGAVAECALSPKVAAAPR